MKEKITKLLSLNEALRIKVEELENKAEDNRITISNLIQSCREYEDENLEFHRIIKSYGFTSLDGIIKGLEEQRLINKHNDVLINSISNPVLDREKKVINFLHDNKIVHIIPLPSSTQFIENTHSEPAWDL